MAASVAACGGPAPGTDGGGGATDAGPPLDAATWYGPAFGAPELVAELHDPLALDDDPSLSADGLEIVFNSDRGSPGAAPHVWRATRGAPTDPFGTPALVAELVTPEGETTPDLAPDGSGIYLATGGATGALDLFFAPRALAGGDTFGAAASIDELGSYTDEDAVAITNDGLEIFFASARDGTLDLFRAGRASATALWDTPVRVDALSTAGIEGGPALSADATVLYFHAETASPLGVHLHRAHRDSTSAAFGAAELVGDLMGPSTADLDPHLTADGSELWFASDRGGDFALWVARR